MIIIIINVSAMSLNKLRLRMNNLKNTLGLKELHGDRGLQKKDMNRTLKIFTRKEYFLLNYILLLHFKRLSFCYIYLI